MNKNAARRFLFAVVSFLTTAALIGLITAVSSNVAFGQITLTPITTGFNNPIGIDHHEPTNKVVMSVNYSGGSPYNFELVAADGTRTQFSTVNGLTDEVKIATVRSGSCQGGFTPGELFTGTGVAGQIARISSDGLTAQIPWVTLPGETGLMRGSLFQDRYCSFGGDLIVVTTDGNVWRVTSGGVRTLLASLGTHLEGVTTVPNDTAKYGPWAGKILAGAEGQGRIYTIDSNGVTAFYQLGINPEDFDIVPANENFFGVDFGGQTLWGAPASAFTGMVGDILIAQEFPGILWHVRWNGSSFEATEIARVTQWEHVTFSKAGIVEIPPAEICGNGIDDDRDGFIDEADSDCQVCGDGNLDPLEQCDDGNTTSGDGCSATCQLENQPPVCTSATASPSTLWPPNHKMVDIAITGVTDPDGNPVTITANSITQDEAVRETGVGSGNTAPDATLSPLAVRAERNGNPKSPGNGRVYHIDFTADDGNGGMCTGTVTVCVPHDQGKGNTCVDGGPLHNSLAP